MNTTEILRTKVLKTEIGEIVSKQGQTEQGKHESRTKKFNSRRFLF